jgi:hypothetical protein
MSHQTNAIIATVKTLRSVKDWLAENQHVEPSIAATVAALDAIAQGLYDGATARLPARVGFGELKAYVFAYQLAAKICKKEC